MAHSKSTILCTAYWSSMILCLRSNLQQSHSTLKLCNSRHQFMLSPPLTPVRCAMSTSIPSICATNSSLSHMKGSCLTWPPTRSVTIASVQDMLPKLVAASSNVASMARLTKLCCMRTKSPSRQQPQHLLNLHLLANLVILPAM